MDELKEWINALVNEMMEHADPYWFYENLFEERLSEILDAHQKE